jgi:hypothetical protein
MIRHDNNDPEVQEFHQLTNDYTRFCQALDDMGCAWSESIYDSYQTEEINNLGGCSEKTQIKFIQKCPKVYVLQSETGKRTIIFLVNDCGCDDDYEDEYEYEPDISAIFFPSDYVIFYAKLLQG